MANKNDDADFIDDLLNPPPAPGPTPGRGVMVVTAPARDSAELEMWARRLELEGEWPMPFFDENDNLEEISDYERGLLAAQGISEADWREMMATKEGRLKFSELRAADTARKVSAEIEAGKWKRFGVYPTGELENEK